MQILILTTSFPIKKGASSGIFVARLAERLGAKSNLCVLAPMGDAPTGNNIKQSYRLFTFRYAPTKMQLLAHGGGGIPAILAARPGTRLLLPFFLSSMLIHCMWYGRRVDIIFANWSICGMVAGIVGKIFGKPVFTTIRGEDANRAESSRVYRFIIRLCLMMNQKVVTVSDDIAKSLSRQFPAMSHKIVMIPNGVDLIPAASVMDDAKSNANEINLLMVGSLIPRKDVLTALKALSLLPAEFTLSIIGDGPERKKLFSFARELQLLNRVHFIGHINPDDIASHLVHSDVFLITSKSEGRPNALLEACACGIPVVGSDIPGVREIITPDVNGVLFPVGDYDDLARKLLPFSNQSLRVRLGNGGRRLIKERGLTWESTANQYLEQFLKFCG